MAGNIWYFDTYDLRKFEVGDYSTFLDIGANRGTTSFMAKMLNPKARVIAIEPCRETFQYMRQYVGVWWGKKIEYHNFAFGNGNPMSLDRRKYDGRNRFYSDNEKKWWKSDTYEVPSYTLAQIFEKLHIDVSRPYIVKVDCEGGERFIFEQEAAEGLLRGAMQVVMEIHYGLGGTRDQWNAWLRKLSGTHELRVGQMFDRHHPTERYEFVPCPEIPFEKGLVTIELINREWKARGY
jgi:FkbM family methyltransferase